MTDNLPMDSMVAISPFFAGIGQLPHACFGLTSYPTYLIPFLGVAKLLGAIAILVPGFPRIKEWAYAGLFFGLAGATYSVIMLEGLQPQMSGMLIFFGLGALSYIRKRSVTAPKLVNIMTDMTGQFNKVVMVTPSGLVERVLVIDK